QPEAMKAVRSVARRNGILIFIARKPLVGRGRKQTRSPNGQPCDAQLMRDAAALIGCGLFAEKLRMSRVTGTTLEYGLKWLDVRELFGALASAAAVHLFIDRTHAFAHPLLFLVLAEKVCSRTRLADGARHDRTA